MARRRGKGEGSIYKQSNGKWRAQIWVDGDRLGKVFDTHRDAADWIREIRSELESGLSLEGYSLQYKYYLDEWLGIKKQTVAEQTWSYYNQIIRDYIKPNLGYLNLRDITTRKIQKFYNDMVERGIGLRTIEKSHSIIHASLNAAVKNGLISNNQDQGTEPPRPKKREMKYLDRDEVKELLKSTKVNNDRNYAIYFLAITSGMRQGELLGLKWKNVDLEKGVISVNISLKRLPIGKLVLDKPKTESSIRKISIGDEGIEVLKEQKKRLKIEKGNNKDLWNENGFVFPSTIGTAMDPSNLLKKFRQSLKKAGVKKIRFHDLRHTAASLMLNNGVDLLVASRRLGHAKPSITLDVYGHLLSSRQNEVANKIEKLIS